MSFLANDMRARLAAYLDGVTTLEVFYDWLVANTWDIERRHDPEAEALTYEIKGPLAEHSSGSISEDEIRLLLRPLVASAPVPAAT